MSIYATMMSLKFPRNGEVGFEEEDWVEVFFQMVPEHIRDEGEGWEWLPSPPEDEDTPRAVVIVTAGCEKGTDRCGQEYVDPLMTLTWVEYEGARWEQLHSRICEELEKRYRATYDSRLGADRLALKET